MSFKRMLRYHLSKILKSQYVHHDGHLCHGDLRVAEVQKYVFQIGDFQVFPQQFC